MDLYLIRHADAVPLGEQGITDDAHRPLSAKGIIQTIALAGSLGRMGVRLEKIVSSPLLRAKQTAEGMLKSWRPAEPELVFCDELAFGGKRRRLARFVSKLEAQSVALVGHQPDLSELAGWLIGSRNSQMEFAKAGAAYIVCDDTMGKGSGALIWLVTPEWYTEQD